MIKATCTRRGDFKILKHSGSVFILYSIQFLTATGKSAIVLGFVVVGV